MLNFNDAELAEMKSGGQNIAAFWRLDVEPDPVLLWLGFGNIVVDHNVFDPDGAEYQGFGDIGNLPAFNQMMNGAAQRVDFTLSGVSGEIGQIALNHDGDKIKGKRVAAGFGIFGPDWNLLGIPHWLATFRADVLKVDQPPVTDDSTPMCTVALSCGSLLTSRRRPQFSYFSSRDQKSRFPGDLACDLVGKYSTGFQKKWPTFPS